MNDFTINDLKSLEINLSYLDIYTIPLLITFPSG